MTPTTNPNHHHHHHQQQQQQSSRVLYELSSLVLSILRSPNFSDQNRAAMTSSMMSPVVVRRRVGAMTTGGLASLMLGISLALMLCGSVTFLIGFMLLPWVVGLVLVFYFVGFVSTLSVLGRAFLCFISTPNLDHHHHHHHPSPPSRKDIPAWKFL